MTIKTLQIFNRKKSKKENNKAKTSFKKYMELIDDNLILVHHGKSFKEVLSFSRAIDLLIEDNNILRTQEVEEALMDYYKQEIISA